jgi:hypothetical protein
MFIFILADDSSRPQSPAPKKQAMVELYDDPVDDQDHEKEELLQAENSKKRVCTHCCCQLKTLYIYSRQYFSLTRVIGTSDHLIKLQI